MRSFVCFSVLALLFLAGCADPSTSSPDAPARGSSDTAEAPASTDQVREPIYALQVDARGRMWAGTERGMLRRNAENASWTRVHVSGVQEGFGDDAGERVYSMIRHVMEGPEGALYAGHHRLFRSPDGGQTWTPVDDRLQTGGGMGDVAVLAAADSLVFAGFVSAGLWRSATDGRLWARVLGEDDTHVAAVTGAPGGTVFAVTLARDTRGAQLHRSADGGRTWTAAGPVPVRMRSLVADTTGTLYGAGFRADGGGLAAVESADDGKTWTEIESLERVTGFQRTPTGRLLALGMTGVFLRTPSGWARMAPTQNQVHAAAVTPGDAAWIATRSGITKVPLPVQTP